MDLTIPIETYSVIMFALLIMFACLKLAVKIFWENKNNPEVNLWKELVKHQNGFIYAFIAGCLASMIFPWGSLTGDPTSDIKIIAAAGIAADVVIYDLFIQNPPKRVDVK